MIDQRLTEVLSITKPGLAIPIIVETRQETNIFDCVCMGKRNKQVLREALILEKDRHKQFEHELLEDIKHDKQRWSSTGLGGLLKQGMVESSNEMLSSVRDDIIHINELLDDVSNTETCGD